MSVAKWNQLVESAAAESTNVMGFSGGTRQDLMRRFTETPLAANLQLMRRTVRLETNHPAVLELARKFFERHQYGTGGPAEFTWRLVCESDPRVQSTAVPLSAFSDSGLRYVNFGQRSFLAVDLETRQAIGFLAERFFEGELRLRPRPPLNALFCMTAASLGLTALSGGCVGKEDRGVLVFGPPNSGKTTACYLAARHGLEFHADQVIFLDQRESCLCAWGDLFPAVFRPEALQHLPELVRATCRSEYGELSFYFLDKSVMQARSARPVIPVCSLILDRGASCDAKLEEISTADAVSRLKCSMLFEEGPQFEQLVLGSLTALAEKPVYSLRYGSDPQIAANYIQQLLR